MRDKPLAFLFHDFIFQQGSGIVVNMAIDIDPKKINELLTHGAEEVIVEQHLRDALKSGKKLRVKLGIDPTSPDLHLGHAIVLRKLRAFQNAGHKAVLIIGDFTARVGDPSGRVRERKLLTEREIKENMKKYLKLADKIIDTKKAEIVHNSKWFEKEGMKEVIMLASAGSLQQVLHRADFKKRLSEDNDITLLEVFYPVMQGYDSVKVKADIELGGTDQKFNLLMGRRVQRHFGNQEQDILTTPLLVGLDGEKKMSKSYNNYIALDDTPKEMFGKIMSVNDSLLQDYFTLCTNLSEGKIRDALHRGPRDAKIVLAKEIVTLYHDAHASKKAEEHFVNVFTKKKKPSDIHEVQLGTESITVLELLTRTNLAKSNGEARRLIKQRGVRINDVKKLNPDEEISLKNTILLQVGKRKFLKVKT
jgi:tyrosyl-tRNA synthetase